MTLVEFIAPLDKNSHRILAILYYKKRYESVVSLTVDPIRAALRTARVPGWKKINVADVLNKSGHYVDSPGSLDAKRLWSLTDSGEQHVRDLLHLPAAEPEIEHDVGSLEGIASKITDPDVRSYIDEAIKCLQIGALRASVVFLWAGAIRTIQEEMLAAGTTKLNAALSKHDPKAHKVSRVDDFAYIKDKVVLLVAQDLGVVDKGQRTTLEDALKLRNNCGHPTRYKPGVQKVSSFVEDVVGIVFS